MYITACKEEMIKQLPQSSKGELDQLEHSIKSKKRELEQVKNDLQVREMTYLECWVFVFTLFNKELILHKY